MKKFFRTARFWFPVILWMATIFAFSTRQRIQVSEQGMVNFLFFKTLHVIEYFALYVVTFRAIRNTRKRSSDVGNYWVTFMVTVFYAITDEVHQRFVPTREGRPRDVIIDAGGMILAWFWITQLLPKVPKKLKIWAKNWQLIS